MDTQNGNARGGKRINAGRPTLPAHLKKQTTVIRVDVDLLPAIEALKNNGSNVVTNNQDAEIERLREININLVMKYDAEHLQVINLKSKLDAAKSEPATLRQRIKELENQVSKQKYQQCQSLTGNGCQCERKAMHENKINGFVIYLCEQHYKKFV